MIRNFFYIGDVMLSFKSFERFRVTQIQFHEMEIIFAGKNAGEITASINFVIDA